MSEHRHEWFDPEEGPFYCGGHDGHVCSLKYSQLTSARANALERLAERVRFRKEMYQILLTQHTVEARSLALSHPHWNNYVHTVLPEIVQPDSFADWLVDDALAALDAADGGAE